MSETCERCIFYHAFPVTEGTPGLQNMGACVVDPPQPVVLAGERIEWHHPVVHQTTPACRHYSFKPL